MRLPKVGTWLRIWWQDSNAADEWQDPAEDQPRLIEISVGYYMGLTEDNKMKLPPSMSFRLDNGMPHLKMDQLEIPLATVIAIEKLPPANPRPPTRERAAKKSK